MDGKETEAQKAEAEKAAAAKAAADAAETGKAAKKTAKADKAAADEFVSPACEITAKPKAGLWRGGAHHPCRTVEHKAGAFAEATWAFIIAEPTLVVTVKK